MPRPIATRLKIKVVDGCQKTTNEMGAERREMKALQLSKWGYKNGLRHRESGRGSACIAVWKNTTVR